jgi:UTP-glucose-1-phosphate uridylyltransferase
LLDYSVFDALRAGFERVVFIIRRDIEAEFREKIGARYEGRIAVDYVFQQLDTLPGGFSVPEGRQKPWGTAHAIWCARDALTGPFAAINADDFYGEGSYAALARFLAAGPSDTTRFAMAGYRLDRTLSENGSVARGVCEVDAHGRLRHIVECTSIERSPEGIRQKEADGQVRTFTGTESVSMNFWGLTPAVFPLLEGQLITFLREKSTDPKAECYIPMAIGEMVTRGEATVDVLPTDATWFGVTYREDKPVVMQSLAALHADGTYPTPLWK